MPHQYIQILNTDTCKKDGTIGSNFYEFLIFLEVVAANHSLIQFELPPHPSQNLKTGVTANGMVFLLF